MLYWSIIFEHTQTVLHIFTWSTLITAVFSDFVLYIILFYSEYFNYFLTFTILFRGFRLIRSYNVFIGNVTGGITLLWITISIWYKVYKFSLCIKYYIWLTYILYIHSYNGVGVFIYSSLDITKVIFVDRRHVSRLHYE